MKKLEKKIAFLRKIKLKLRQRVLIEKSAKRRAILKKWASDLDEKVLEVEIQSISIA